ncbi:TetR/AcrR family transcriptional regulator [Cellulosimicrobium cellulans]|uniref:TetR/AcrR family transcriptional regulator n=1 Tax=Cellulosimicrobium cellulans TaxID=1710 RepID=UPI001883C7BB|nr:TetR/AcrR family transcriptional regulator [Cellulosimicrobium cellulans]MBE9925259.1 TetR/AcrR family transcriptional regulator [Cellulosimicrobium cellulans]
MHTGTRPEPRADAPGSNRDRLVAAAQELFWAQGVGATSPRQVLAASGVGHGSLYHHFPTKHDLAAAAVHATTTAGLDAARRDLGAQGSAVERLVRYLERPRPALAGCKVGRLVSDQAVMDDAALAAEVRAYFRGLVDLAAAVLVEGGLPDDAARDRAHAAVAVVQGGYVLARALDDPDAMSAAARGFVALLDPLPTTSEDA